MKFNLSLPTKVHFGKGSLVYLKEELSTYKKVLLVYGGGSIKRNGIYDDIIKLLNELKIDFFEYSGIEPNPKSINVEEASLICQDKGIDFILAVGGGSVIDAAKAIALKSKNMDIDFWKALKDAQIITKALPIGTISTISGTGSETNCGFGIINTKSKEKLGYFSFLSYPKFAILDPTYTRSVPKNHTRSGIIDIIAHLFEQYFTSLDDSDVLIDHMLTRIEDLIKRSMTAGKSLLEDLEDYKLREEIMYYAHIALNTEIAFKVNRGDWSSHLLESALNGVYNTPHGDGLGIIFPHWMEYAATKRVDRLKRMAINIFSVNSEGSDEEISKKGILAFKEYLELIEAPRSLSDININNFDLDLILETFKRGHDKVGSYIVLGTKEVEEIFYNISKG